MTYDQLIAFQVVIREGSFKKASEVLFKTQPSLSVSIKNLEVELGITLFDRSGYRPKLTLEGEAFYKKSKGIIEDFNDLLSFGKELSLGLEAEIKISLDAIFPVKKLQSLFSTFFDPSIQTALSLSVDVLEGAMEKVLDGEVDFAISSYIAPSENIEAIKLLDVYMTPCIGKSLLKDHTLSDLLKIYPQIIVKSSSQKRSNKILGDYPKAKKWYTSDISMKLELIKNNLGWGRLPNHLVSELIEDDILEEIKGLPLIQEVSIPLYLLRSRTKLMGPNTKRLWNFIQDTFFLVSKS